MSTRLLNILDHKQAENIHQLPVPCKQWSFWQNDSVISIYLKTAGNVSRII